MKKLLIIIPAFDEEANISNLLKNLCIPEIEDLADILVINDASRDQTGLIIKKHSIKMVTHVFNLGYGSALQVGYKYAVRNNYDYVVQIDADGQHCISNIFHIYNCLNTPDKEGNLPDIVIGSHFVRGSRSFKISGIKKFSIRLFSWIIKKTTGRIIKDPTSGLQGLNRKAFLYYSKYGNFDHSYPDANMIIQMLLLGFRIEETASVMHERRAGISMHTGLIKQMTYMLVMPLSTLTTALRIKKERGKLIHDFREFDNKSEMGAPSQG
ncbi:MAG TPA: glycosyltransferase family 2 protein [Clostridia bacterium]|nr:glycosyltransferase family 2 protein [Clostridia bacterium]